MQFRINKIQFRYQDDELYINEKLIDCPKKVLQALILFVTSKNEIISKDVLMAKIWGASVVSEDSLFKVIHGVRAVLKEHGVQGDILVNVYGKGYKINPTIKKSFFKIPTKEIPTKALQQTIRSKKTTLWMSLITVVLLVIVLSYIFLTKFSIRGHQRVITDKIYNKLHQQIKTSPVKSLVELNKTYDLEKLMNIDKMSILYLRAWSYYNQGNYKKSIQNLDLGKDIYTDKVTVVLGDIYWLLAVINLYRAESQLMLEYLSKAEEIYSSVNKKHEINRSADLIAEYHLLEHNYDLAIEASKSLLQKAQKYNNYIYQIKAHLNLSDVYLELNNAENRLKHLQNALDVALKIGSPKYISYAYGTMAVDSIANGEFIKAMNWVNKTLAYTVVQSSTNDFQQGFSYLYNVLSVLGHNQLAEFYLQKAIDIQNKFNSDGHLHLAELNLGILKFKLKKYQQSLFLFDQLLTYNLSFSERSEVLAWKAVTHYHLNDIISSYAFAKEVYNSKNISSKVKFVAGIALALSARGLERSSEMELTFQQISLLANPDWLIEYSLYLDTALDITKNDVEKHDKFLAKRSEFDTILAEIKQKTMPNTALLTDLNIYIDRILQETSK